jgi:hypothetical protein
LQWIAVGVLSVIVAGCGGPSEERARADQARYARQSNAICREERAQARLAVSETTPTIYITLKVYANAARDGLKRAAAKLHGLRARLGDAGSAQIDAFDRALDPFVTSIGALATVEHGEPTRQAAERIRRRGDTLFDAAQAAKVTGCGRGGNAIADRAELVVYVAAYDRLQDSADARLLRSHRRFKRSAAGSEGQEIASAGITRGLGVLYRGMGRLDPPRQIRRYHQAYRRALRAVLDTRKQLDEARAGFEQLDARLHRQADRVGRTHRRLRRELYR